MNITIDANAKTDKNLIISMKSNIDASKSLKDIRG